MVRLASTGILGALLLPGAFGEISCVPIIDDDGTTTCAATEMVVGSALLQKHHTTKAIVTVNDTEDVDVEDDEQQEEELLEKQNQHLLSTWLLQQHQSMSRTTGAYSMYRVTITENYGANGCGGSTTCIQFAELNLYHGDEEVSYDGASFEQGDGENSPRREAASKAFDNNPGTKFLTRKGEDVKVLTITLAAPAEVDHMSFTTGNDAASRDPKRFKLEGSNDGESWDMVVDKTAEDLPQTQDRRAEGESVSASGGGGGGEAPAADDAPGSGDGGSGGAPPGGSGGAPPGGSGGGSGGGGDAPGSGGGGSGGDEPAAPAAPAEPAAPAAGGDSGADPDVWVNAVNAHRADHGACPLTWAAPLADGIKEWCDGLTSLHHADSYHIPPPGGPCGENLAWASNGITAEQAVQMWYDEVNDCASPLPGCQEPKPGKATGHFTAMMWKGATTMGCAISADGNYAGCRWKAGDSLSADTPNMAMPGLYEANVGALGEAPTGC